MDFQKQKVVRRIVQTADSRKTIIVNQKKGGHNLQMYLEPPSDEISIVEFDELALRRLKVLKAVEDIKERFTIGSEDYLNEMRKELKMLMPIAVMRNKTVKTLKDSELVEVYKLRQHDIIGHFILRLAFCRSPESQKWLIQQEADLFKFRMQNESQDEVANFLKENKINIEQVSEKERRQLGRDLSNACRISLATLEANNFWKIDFVDACDLVKRRRCLLKKGMAYLSSADLQVIITSMLRIQMAAAMNRAFKHLGMMEEGGRILPRLSRLVNNAYSGKDYAGKGQDGVTRHMIDKLCASSFPLCMKTIHHRFRTDHHLRHGARRQYGLFLKAIGLSIDEAMMFMREEFTKKIDSEKFEKQYAYNIRHMYGKEGRRMDYPALPCSAIILGAAPTTHDCHGCPYKHSEPKLLAQRLQKEGLNKQQVDMIVTMVGKSQLDKACTRHFEFTHQMTEGGLGQSITHPNQFYELSQQVVNGKRSSEEVRLVTSVPVQQVPVAPSASQDPDDSFDEE